MKTLHCHVLFFILSFFCVKTTQGADIGQIDSLENRLKHTKGEELIPILGELSKAYLPTDANKSLNYAGKALEVSEKYKNDELIALSNLFIADVYFEMSRFQPAIEFYEKALEYFYEQKSPDKKIYIFNKLGHSEKLLGNYDNALFHYQKPINLYQAKNDHKVSEVYNNIGTIYKLQGQFSDAFYYHQLALKESNLVFDQEEMANTLNYIGSLYWSFSQYDSSLFYYEKSLEIFRDIENILGEASVLSNIGTVFKNRGEFKTALEYNTKALELRTSVNNKKEMAKSYNQIGSIYLANNDLRNALKLYQLSLNIRIEINDIIGIAQSNNNLALVYKKLNNYQESLSYFEKSLNHYYNIGNKTLIASSINEIGGIYKKLNRYDSALENYLQALKIQQDLNNNDKIASILTNIGIIYNEIGNFDKALESYFRALELKKEVGNKKEIAYSLHIIGNTYLKLNNYSEALAKYNESLDLRTEIGDKVSIASSYKSLGNTYLQMNDFNNSIENLNEALKITDEIGDIKGVSNILNDIGNFYLQTNREAQALNYFNRTIDICDKTEDQVLKGLCLRKIGVIQLNSGAVEQGVGNINKSLLIGQNTDNLELIKNAYFEFFTYYNKTGNKSRALDNYINYTIIKDTINSKLNSQRLIEIQMNFELEKSYNEISRIEDEIIQLTAENRIRELELRKQKNVRNLLFIIVLITLISVILILYQFLAKRKTNILLKEKIKEVDESNKLLKSSEDDLKILNATKDKFFSIIAHDLRNPFNALHGLTQHLLNNYEDFEDDEIKQSIELIYNSADDLLELLENLLHWSRTQRGVIKFDPKELNLNDVVLKTFHILSINAEKKQIKLVNKIKEDELIFADYEMLTAVLRNLISNAIKFSHPDSSIIIESHSADDYIEITVTDEGIGITEENMKKLFRIDIHHSTSGTSQEQGSGLGLILCREFVEKHKGKIWVESKINKGSKFKFTISKKSST